MRPLAFAILLALAGCAQPPPQVVAAPPVVEHQLLRDIVPASTLQCLGAPNGDKAVSTRDVARYIVALRSAGADCRRKLKVLADLIAGEK